MELAVGLIERTGRGLVAHHRLDQLATDHTPQVDVTHLPFNRAAGNIEDLALHLPPDLAHAIGLEVGVDHPAYSRLHPLVALRAWRLMRWTAALCHTLVIGGLY